MSFKKLGFQIGLVVHIRGPILINPIFWLITLQKISKKFLFSLLLFCLSNCSLINLLPQCKPSNLNNLNVFIKFFQDFFAPTLIFQLSLSNWHCRPLQTNLPERISKNMLKPDYAFQSGSLSLFWLLKGISLLRWQRPKSCHTFNFFTLFSTISSGLRGCRKMLNF